MTLDEMKKKVHENQDRIEELELENYELLEEAKRAIATEENRDAGDLDITQNWECEDEYSDASVGFVSRKSPIGWCVYDVSTDPGDHDECIYCGQPDERK